jgi:hypothetical protein
MTAPDRPAVLYLARGIGAGLPAAERFLASHAAHPAGAPHDLVVLRKGFADAAEAEALAALSARHDARVLDLPDDGFDWGAYFRAAHALPHRLLLCLNSHSRIEKPDWLASYLGCAALGRAGALGATGSWQVRRFTTIAAGLFVRHVAQNRSLLHGAAEGVQQYGRVLREWCQPRLWHFPAFPNPHLRSNAFLVEAALLRSFAERCAIPADKEHAFRLESGRRGFTRWLDATARPPMVVAHGGAAFAAGDWPSSGTYRVPDQPGLLVSDNVTRIYAQADAGLRHFLELTTWGRGFTPFAPLTAAVPRPA